LCIKFLREFILFKRYKYVTCITRILCYFIVLCYSYYPLHPAHEDVNMDYEHFENHCYMPITPDVLVVPSDLRYFAKVVYLYRINPKKVKLLN